MYGERRCSAGSPPLSVSSSASLSASSFRSFDCERLPFLLGCDWRSSDGSLAVAAAADPAECSPYAAHCSWDASLSPLLLSPSPLADYGGSPPTLSSVSTDSSTCSAECDAVQHPSRPKSAAAAVASPREAAVQRRARERSLVCRLETLTRSRTPTTAKRQRLLPRAQRQQQRQQDEVAVRGGKEAVLEAAAAQLEDDAETIRQLKAELSRLTNPRLSNSGHSELRPRRRCELPSSASLPSAERRLRPSDCTRFHDERRTLASSVLLLGHMTMFLVDMSTGFLLDANQSAAAA